MLMTNSLLLILAFSIVTSISIIDRLRRRVVDSPQPITMGLSQRNGCAAPSSRLLSSIEATDLPDDLTLSSLLPEDKLLEIGNG